MVFICENGEVTFASWLALTGAWFAALALPGPDIFLILKLGLRDRRQAVLAAFGIMSGNVLWITISVLGITALMRSYPLILPAIQIFGVLVLGFLGVQSVRSGVRQIRSGSESEVKTGRQNAWLLGLVTNLANPKALIFFTALLAQFIPPGASWGLSLGIIIFMVFVGLAWFVGLALASSISAFRVWFVRAAPWFDVVAGSVFIVVAALIAIEVVKYLLTL